MSFVEEQQVKALAELFPVYGNNIDEKVTNKIVSDTIIATCEEIGFVTEDCELKGMPNGEHLMRKIIRKLQGQAEAKV